MTEQLKAEQLQSAKQAVVIELNSNFRNLVNFIQHLPLNEQFKSFAFQNLDQGMFWVQKGIELLAIEQAKPVEEPEKQEPAITDSCS